MEDINPEWVSLARRIESSAGTALANNKNDGIAIITMHVAVDSAGKPLVWVLSEPKRVEPSRVAKKTLMKLLSSG